MRYSARQSQSRARWRTGTEQCLSGAPPDCPVAQKTEAPTVRIQRLGDVAGALDSVRWRHATAAFTKRLVWWLGL
jgi:hypothetical protein